MMNYLPAAAGVRAEARHVECPPKKEREKVGATLERQKAVAPVTRECKAGHVWAFDDKSPPIPPVCPMGCGEPWDPDATWDDGEKLKWAGRKFPELPALRVVRAVTGLRDEGKVVSLDEVRSRLRRQGDDAA